MLVFIDESGHPHHNDPTERPAVVAVCMAEGDARRISGQIYGLKQLLLPTPDTEMKARSLLTRGTFKRIPEKREFVEAFFDLCKNLPITAFSIVMQRPETEISRDYLWLPNQFRYLLQRAHYLAEEQDDYATILFDGDGSQAGGLPQRFDSFLFRGAEGQSLTAIADSPYYVDSRNTVGIQIADMFAGVVRLYEEGALFAAHRQATHSCQRSAATTKSSRISAETSKLSRVGSLECIECQSARTIRQNRRSRTGKTTDKTLRIQRASSDTTRASHLALSTIFADAIPRVKVALAGLSQGFEMILKSSLRITKSAPLTRDHCQMISPPALTLRR